MHTGWTSSAMSRSVWRAFTEGAHLARWCAPGAQIAARAGGLFRASVDRVTEMEAHIDVFDPGRRLRLIYLPSAALPAADTAIVADFIMELAAEAAPSCACSAPASRTARSGTRSTSACARLGARHGAPQGLRGKADEGRAEAGPGKQMIGFLFRAVIAALGLWLATRWVTGIRIDSPPRWCSRACCSAW